MKKILLPIERVLQKANIGKHTVKKLVLVGGSSKIPMVRKMLAEYFGNKSLLDFASNPQDIVAQGAAFLAF